MKGGISMAEAIARIVDFEQSSDADLVDMTQRGARGAFAAIMQRHNRRLYRVARSVLRDDAEAEDVVQETYVRAYGALRDYRGEATLASWLTRIALNEAFDRLRRRRPSVAVAALDEADNRREDSVIRLHSMLSDTSPEKDAALTEIRALVERAVDALPEAFRTVFVMRDIEEMSIEETAAQLGIRAETVKTRLHRARRLLRDRLEDTLAAALTDSFPFDGARCSTMSERVLKRLGLD
jgi:RNA polymerase sigma-70 factor (ECF subfamily)